LYYVFVKHEFYSLFSDDVWIHAKEAGVYGYCAVKLFIFIDVSILHVCVSV